MNITPKNYPLHHYDLRTLQDKELLATQLENPYTVSSIAARVADMTDTAITQAIIHAAVDAGVTDLYLIDKKFIKEAIKEQLDRDNPQPLTIEELRQMDQEPVYVVPLNHGKDTAAEWCVMWHDEAAIPGDECWAWPINNYGKTWIAYRYKPKEVE